MRIGLVRWLIIATIIFSTSNAGAQKLSWVEANYTLVGNDALYIDGPIQPGLLDRVIQEFEVGPKGFDGCEDEQNYDAAACPLLFNRTV